MATAIPLAQASENERKIPRAVFLTNVEQFAQQYGSESLLNQLNELYSKFKFMESQLHRTKQVLRNKVPDITNALDMVKYLSTNDSALTIDFQLADNIWTKAHLPSTSTVALWLGANVMLEYPHSEALELLQKNLAGANKSICSTEEDLKFLKEQITTCEVNIARVHNYIVSNRRPS